MLRLRPRRCDRPRVRDDVERQDDRHHQTPPDDEIAPSPVQMLLVLRNPQSARVPDHSLEFLGALRFGEQRQDNDQNDRENEHHERVMGERIVGRHRR